ncbi:MAG: hypothetical protein ACE5JS_10275 [Nitrospinota bacterium]
MIGHVNLGSLFFAGLSAGYLMAFVGYWMEGFLKLPRFDCSQDGVVYLGGEKRERWVVGIIFHLFDSVLFALIYAAWFIDVVAGPLWLRGLIFGVALAVAVQITIIVGSAGGGVHFKKIPKTPLAIFIDLFLTTIYGVALGVLYVPGS